MAVADNVVWTPMALPTLKLVQPKLRYGAVVVSDNTLSAAEGYKDLLEYLRAPGRLLTPCTIPPLSEAILTKLSTLRAMFPPGISRLSFPHSHAKIHPLGDVAGIGGMGLRRSGSRRAPRVSFNQAPRPTQEENI